MLLHLAITVHEGDDYPGFAAEEADTQQGFET